VRNCAPGNPEIPGSLVSLTPRNDVPIQISNSRCESAFSRREPPELCSTWPPENRGRRESRMLAAPAALRAKLKQAHKRNHHRFRRNNPTFPARWFYGLLRTLPGGAGLLSPSPHGKIPQDLTPASRRQDHTTWPYALAFSSGERIRLTPRRPSHPPPNVRDDRETPHLVGPGRRK